MSDPQLTPPASRRMRANRKVLEKPCTSCGRAFSIAEEVYACAACTGYHHIACLDAAGACLPQVIAADPTSDAGAAPPAAAAGESPQDPGLPSPSVVPAAVADDERTCPSCAEVIKKAAMKCRFCGTLLDAELIRKTAEETIPEDVLEGVRTAANKAVWQGIIGLFICAPVLGPLAISNGREAVNSLDLYPGYPTSLRTRARSGIVLGWVAIVLFVIVLAFRLNSL
jgi:hypothetical protein